MIIDLRSDTVTMPNKGMLEAMMQAEVGDDVFGEDPTIIKLEANVAAMFGKEAALFVPSGTMANQIAIKVHTQPMDEIILDKNAHIYYYETAGYAFHSGVSVKLVDGKNGIISSKDVIDNIQAPMDWLPKTSLVCLENTHNKGGGACYELEALQKIKQVCTETGLKVHIDGARIWNALEAKKYATHEIGKTCDSISVCFSKGLGAPVGSAIIGDSGFIKKARRVRKAFGGGMRQVGILGAACIYALEHNFEKLALDHQHAKEIAHKLMEKVWVKSILPVETNMIIFEIDDTKTNVLEIIQLLKDNGILVVQFGPKQIRMVFHLGITPTTFLELKKLIQKINI